MPHAAIPSPTSLSVAQTLAKLPLIIRVVLAGLFGAAGAWGMPPDAQPLALIVYHGGLVVLLASVNRAGSGFALGWAAAFGFHLFGLAWVGEAFLVDAERFAWMRPFAMVGLPAGLALFAGLASAVYVRFARRRPLADVLLYSALFMTAEWLRGNILTGFPWNLPVQTWDRVLGVLQGVAWIGPYGLSLLTVMVAAAAGAAIVYPRRSSLPAIAAAILPLCLVAALGFWRIAAAPAEMPTVPGVKLRLVQPNIPQREKWLPAKAAEHFQRHLALSAGAAKAGVTHVIWPEAATPFLLLDAPDALAAASRIVPPGGALITGTPRRVAAATEDATAAAQIGNALVVLTEQGTLAAVYDKHHLVPFGEYVPLRKWLPIERLAAGRGDFAPGPGPQTLTVPGAPPLSPLVCYEAIFPGEVTAADSRPAWLLNITNDAWFGSSAGPAQHLAIARLRAIEEGLPLIRVASTGISAVIDPYGRILRSLPIGQSAVIDSRLPQAIGNPPLFTEVGNIPFFVLIGIFVAFSRFRSR